VRGRSSTAGGDRGYRSQTVVAVDGLARVRRGEVTHQGTVEWSCDDVDATVEVQIVPEVDDTRIVTSIAFTPQWFFFFFPPVASARHRRQPGRAP